MTTRAQGKRWVLAAYPVGEPKASDFRLEPFDLAEPADGEVLVRVAYHTVAPGVRAKLAGETYTAQVKLGDPIPGYGVGIIERSAAPEFQVGEKVVGDLAWSTHALVRAPALQGLDPAIFDSQSVPLHAAIGMLGASGLTAYFGLLRIGDAKPGETVLISSASGAVGSAVGQIARNHGCRVIGIAGSAAKCTELIDIFGFDAAIDYRAEADISAAIKLAAPDGIDLYYDNVGGEISEAAVGNMKLFGRIVVCGQTSDYNRTEARGFQSMTTVVTRRLTIRGFVVHDFAAEFPAARKQLAAWLHAGSMVHNANIVDGIEGAVTGFVGQFSGKGVGRPLIKAS